MKRSVPYSPLVVAVIYDDLCAFEYACAAEVFGLPRPELGDNWYRFRTCSVDGKVVTGPHGLRIRPHYGLEGVLEASTVVIPGWRCLEDPVPKRLIGALRAAHERGIRIVSICSGSFVLAAAGLLDGQRATTHWLYAETLQRLYPAVKVDPDVLYVDAGGIMTSAGSAAGLDLCLHLVRSDYGPKIANHLARRLVIPPHRDGGQAQFVERPVQKYQTNPISKALDQMQRRLNENLTIVELARLAAMSERTFIRRFKSTTGVTPTAWLVRLRLDKAKQLLESSEEAIELIATASGFGSAATLRHHFRDKLGISPGAYRARFNPGPRPSGKQLDRRQEQDLTESRM